MHQFSKHYTLEEARALLPRLREIFVSIHENKRTMETTEEKLGELMEETGGDLGGQEVVWLIEGILNLRDGMMEIARMGIQVKDIDRGLVDFPSIRNGREVFLCWELDEDDIEFWHDLEAGYAGRERL